MSYTKGQEARLNEFDEITYDQAVALSAEIDQPLKSIISKAQFMGIPYIKKVVPTPKPVQITKAELVTSITVAVGGLDVSGLLGATRDSLVELEAYLNQE